MTTKWNTFWNRLRGKINTKSGFAEQDSDLPEVGGDGLLAEPITHPSDAEVESQSDKPTGPLVRLSKREQAIAQLQQGYDRVTQLIEDIQKHLASQGERSDRICSSLDQLARSMSDTPNLSRQQAHTLEAIVGQLEMTNVRTQQLTETVGEIPKITRAQSDTLAGINRQLEMAGEQNVVANQTMDKLGQAITALGESNNSQAQILQEINAKTNQQNEVLSQLIAKQSKRFTMLFIVTVLLAAAAVATTIVGIVL
ncbi:MAG: hypothetical protein JSV03_10900 [Planctomycetota bacterium]|nr:MAG: hypothetical protein JSV03_10900 [Planctomycetota bacterium]